VYQTGHKVIAHILHTGELIKAFLQMRWKYT